MDSIGNINRSPISFPPPSVDIIVARFGNGKRPGGSILTGAYLFVVVMRVAVMLSANLSVFLPGILRITGGKASISVINNDFWAGYRGSQAHNLLISNLSRDSVQGKTSGHPL
jgi:hypothetical protein